jgi:hypothetical protein
MRRGGILNKDKITLENIGSLIGKLMNEESSSNDEKKSRNSSSKDSKNSEDE